MSSGTNPGSPSIRKVDARTSLISTVVALPSGFYANALAVDSSGNIYVAFWNKFVIMRYNSGSGYSATAIAGNLSATAASPGTNGPATSSGLGIIGGLALDQARGYLYASDSSNSLLYRIDLASGTLSIAAGVIGTTSLGQPRGISFDAAGNIYIAGNGLMTMAHHYYGSSISEVTPMAQFIPGVTAMVPVILGLLLGDLLFRGLLLCCLTFRTKDNGPYIISPIFSP